MVVVLISSIALSISLVQYGVNYDSVSCVAPALAEADLSFVARYQHLKHGSCSSGSVLAVSHFQSLPEHYSIPSFRCKTTRKSWFVRGSRSHAIDLAEVCSIEQYWSWLVLPFPEEHQLMLFQFLAYESRMRLLHMWRWTRWRKMT